MSLAAVAQVPLTLEEMFCGCLKYQRYMRDMFVGTKWERREDDVFSLKVRPGETYQLMNVLIIHY